MTKIVFMGTPAFSVPILEGLLTEGYEVLAVVTQPDRPVGRKKIITATPVKEAALKHDLLVLQPEKISGSEELDQIEQLQPDVIVTAAFGQFLPERLLKVPKIGAINVHASLLPKYRGGAPVHYAIINGEKETGVTIMEMIKKMDAGGVYSQKSIPITDQDDVGTMFDKLSSVGKELLLATLPKIVAGSLQPTPQDESQVTFSPNITREEEVIDWQKTATEINNQIRGMHPWPVAYTSYQGTHWKILKATITAEKTDQAPGTIIERSKKALKIASGEGTVLQIDELQPAGKAQQTIQAFLNGSGQKVQEGQKVE
ncbi:methionyl-tRNA formyltransferase [Enterococcus alishanensis]|uniref:Methionyl-tRNA formyltransferase n=1 Tax=Enterococcus alishanensis TaxID=1303817 RepID=A0ABS6TG18_9ENTE|nr:methionyl-tRNA formyltransferase [Enterococcus alishanensis]MBV7391764.1 methionyl-tRNA formyltransferase [Enterococcus alishanensis]